MEILKIKIQPNFVLFILLDFRIAPVQVVQGDLEDQVVQEDLVGQEGPWDTMEEGLGKYMTENVKFSGILIISYIFSS